MISRRDAEALRKGRIIPMISWDWMIGMASLDGWGAVYQLGGLWIFVPGIGDGS